MTAAAAVDTGDMGLVIEQRGALGLVTLARGQKRNALTIAMRAAIAGTLPRLARDPQIYALVVRSGVDGVFSAGGDIVEMTGLAERDLDAARRALAAELELIWQAECFSKPTVALIDGAVMGGGNAVSLYGTHRVAGARYAFATPETRIGLFPNNGLAHRFARMSGEVGMYLALSGAVIDAGDAWRLGLVTHCIEAASYDAIIAGLADADPVDPILDGLHRDPGPSRLSVHAGVIARCFGAGTVGEIMDRLAAEKGGDAEFAAAVRADLLTRSPLALVVTHRLVREASAMDLKGVLELEHALITRMMELPDLHEGVRAWSRDRSIRPEWRPERLDAVAPAMIEALFAPSEPHHLRLRARRDMQSIST